MKIFPSNLHFNSWNIVKYIQYPLISKVTLFNSTSKFSLKRFTRASRDAKGKARLWFVNKLEQFFFDETNYLSFHLREHNERYRFELKLRKIVRLAFRVKKRSKRKSKKRDKNKEKILTSIDSKSVQLNIWRKDNLVWN